MTDTTETTTTALDRVLSAHPSLSERRRESLRLAAGRGVDEVTLHLLADARLHARRSSIILPLHHYGRGWCRLARSRGTDAIWGERTDDGYRVTQPGTWIVAGHDGFSRDQRDEWSVDQVVVGDTTWTIAS